MALACFITRSLINIYCEHLKIIALLSSLRPGTSFYLFVIWKLVWQRALSFIDSSRYSAAAASAQVQSTAGARSAINRNSNHLSIRPLLQFHSHRRLSCYFRRSRPQFARCDKKKSTRETSSMLMEPWLSLIKMSQSLSMFCFLRIRSLRKHLHSTLSAPHKKRRSQALALFIK